MHTALLLSSSRARLRLFGWLLAASVGAPIALHAQATKIFVASIGNDANDGSRGAPKRNFQAAHNAVATDGQIVVLDTAGYGTLTITKSIAVTVPPGVNGFVTAPATGASAVTVNAGAGSVVSLRGLVLERSPMNPNDGASGIAGFGVGTLNVDDCTIRNFNFGVNFSPSNEGGHLRMRGCTVRQNIRGLEVELAQPYTRLDAVIADCRIQSNSIGLVVESGSVASSQTVSALVADCAISNNSTGINASGSAEVRVDNCRITTNNAGISNPTGGDVLSRGNNTLEHNPNGNTFFSTYSAK